MKFNNYLVLNSKGQARLVKNKPALEWNEVAVELNVNIPNKVFEKPMIKADIEFNGEFENIANIEIKNELEDLIQGNKNLHLVDVNVIDTTNKEEVNQETSQQQE